MDYKQALSSMRPHQVIQMAFAAETGSCLDTVLTHRMIKIYGPELILDALIKLRGKNLTDPASYLFGICKNLRIDRGGEPKDLNDKIILQPELIRLSLENPLG